MARVYEMKASVMTVLKSIVTPRGPMPPGALAA
jgi:hypothetical protein